MPYDDDPRVLKWFESSFNDRRPAVRKAALELVASARFPSWEAFVRRLTIDEDCAVASTAVFLEACRSRALEDGFLELCEGDLALGDLSPELQWEWEYGVRPALPGQMAGALVHVWTREEDDALAKGMALIKSHPFGVPPRCVGIIAVKRLVTRYTRLPRTARESDIWRRSGRPRYPE